MGWFTKKPSADEALNAEYKTLSPDQRAKVDAVAQEAKRAGAITRKMDGATEYYAYPYPGGGTSWGINGGADGFNTKRGVKPK